MYVSAGALPERFEQMHIPLPPAVCKRFEPQGWDKREVPDGKTSGRKASPKTYLAVVPLVPVLNEEYLLSSPVDHSLKKSSIPHWPH